MDSYYFLEWGLQKKCQNIPIKWLKSSSLYKLELFLAKPIHKGKSYRKLEFLIVRYRFLSLFGVESTKKMLEYSDPIVKISSSFFQPNSYIKRRATVSSSLYKLKFFTFRYGFLSLFGMESTNKMLEYSDQMADRAFFSQTHT